MNITDEQVRVALEAYRSRLDGRLYSDTETLTVAELRREAMAAALTAFLSSAGEEPVVTYSGRRLTPEGTTEMWGYLADGVEDLPRGTKLYTAEALAARVAGGVDSPNRLDTQLRMLAVATLLAHEWKWDGTRWIEPATARAGVDELAESIRLAADRWKREADYHASGITDDYCSGQGHAFLSCALEVLAIIDQSEEKGGGQ